MFYESGLFAHTTLSHLLHFRHRYNMEELRGMLAQLKRRADSFDNWASEVRQSLDASAEATKVRKYYILKKTGFIFATFLVPADAH